MIKVCCLIAHGALLILSCEALSSQAVLPLKTVIDDYVHAPDPAYRWEIVSSTRKTDYTSVVIDLVSQTWLSSDETDRPEWQHWLTLAIPHDVKSDVALVFVGGGNNGGDAPASVSDRMAEIALATGTVVAELGMVPNQPLVFHGDGMPRYEDDLIGYTWDQYLRTADPDWLARNAMVKSVVRAMDTVTAVVNSTPFSPPGRSVRGGGWFKARLDDVAHRRHGRPCHRHCANRDRPPERRRFHAPPLRGLRLLGGRDRQLCRPQDHAPDGARKGSSPYRL